MNLDPEQEAQWLAAMADLEEERGPLVPNGAVGGLVARARREQAAAAGKGPPLPLAAARSRGRVRWSFGAIEKPSRRAA